MTTLDLTGLVRPHLVEMTKREDNPNAAEFRLQPLERGYGYTLGNSLRRMLLSSLRGAAVWAFRLDGVVHEHQTIPGVVEDVHQIIQRLKQLTLVLAPDVDEAVLHIKHDKAGPVYARDIEAHSAVSIVNPDQLLFTVQDDRDIGGELYVNKGRGYVEAEQHPVDRTMPIDVVGLSVRSVNSLKNSNIRTLGDLVQYREEDLLKVKNVGEKALGEIAELLRREGLNFGMKFEETEDELKVVDAGAAPQAQASEGDAE